MDVGIDSVWASPTNLHLRVLVWVGKNRHQMKFHASVPLDDIEPDAIGALIAYHAREIDPVEAQQPTLWD